MDKIKRRQYFIDPSFQMAFIFKFCLMVIISCVLIGGVVFALTFNSTTVAIENTRVVVKSTSDFLLPGLFLTVLIVSASSALVMLFMTILVTHKIAGPVFRFKKEIGLMKDGDLNRRFGIRKDDHFQELAKSLNELAADFKVKHIELKNAYHSVLKYLQEKDFCVSRENKEELSGKLARVDDALKGFKVE